MKSGDDLHVGMTLNVVSSAVDRTQKTPISDATCTVDFFAPPKDPKHNPVDRTVDHTFMATFDAGQHAYIVDVPTVGWVPGHWTYRTTLTDTATGWTYDYFDLLA